MAGRLAMGEVMTSAGPLRYFKGPCTYEPSDDTWAAVEALELLLSMGYSFGSVLDLGSGTGVLALVARALFRPNLVAAVDLSPYAVEVSRVTLGTDAAILQCSAASCLRGAWDLVIVNPPYLPSRPGEVEACGGYLDLAWSEEAGHEAMCAAAGRLGQSVLIVRSSLSDLDVDSCLRYLGHEKVLEASRRELFFERLWVEFWSKAPKTELLRP